MKFALATLIALSLGCAGSVANPARVRTPFDESAYSEFSKPGTGSISGRAILVGFTGGMRVCSEREVALDPETAFSSEWIKYEMMRPGFYTADPDPRMLAHRRTTMADIEGRFEFTDVPEGRYYVTCNMITEMVLVVVGRVGYANVYLGEGESLTDVAVTR